MRILAGPSADKLPPAVCHSDTPPLSYSDDCGTDRLRKDYGVAYGSAAVSDVEVEGEEVEFLGEWYSRLQWWWRVVPMAE